MGLTGEINEACVGAWVANKNELKDVNVALKVAEEKKKVTEDQKKTVEKAYDDLYKAVKRAESAFDNAVESMAGGLEAIGLNFLEGVSNADVTLISGMS